MEKLKQYQQELAEQPLARYLEAGERVIWQWQPDFASAYATASNNVIRMLAFIFGGLEVFVAVTAIVNGSGWFAFSLLTLFIGIAAFASINAARKSASQLPTTSYALTTRQAIIIQTTAAGARTTAVPLNNNTPVKLTEQPDGSGTISFGPTDPYPATGLVADSSFRNIPDVARVYGMVRQIQNRQ